MNHPLSSLSIEMNMRLSLPNVHPPRPPRTKPLSNNTKSKHQSRKGLEILPWRRREEEERKERHLIKDLEVRNRRHARAEVPGVTTRVSSHLLSSSDASSDPCAPLYPLMPVRWRGSSPPSKTGVTETEQAARSVTHIQYYVDRQREEKLPGVTQASTERGNSSTEPLSSTKDSQSAKYVEKPLRRSQ